MPNYGALVNHATKRVNAALSAIKSRQSVPEKDGDSTGGHLDGSHRTSSWNGGGGGGRGRGYGGYGGGGYGGGGGGGGAVDDSPTDREKAAGKALGAIAQLGIDDLKKNADNGWDALMNSKKGSRESAVYQSYQNQKAKGNEWFSQLLKQQSSYDALKSKLGNGAYGSSTLDLNTDMERVKDAAASATLEAIQNDDSKIWGDYYTAVNSLYNSWNDLAMDTEKKIREGIRDYATQLNNINPKLADGGDDSIEGLKIDGDDRTVTLPDWLKDQVNYYKKNKVGTKAQYAIDTIRPAMALEKSVGKGLNPGEIAKDAAANEDYWGALTQDYGHRKR